MFKQDSVKISILPIEHYAENDGNFLTMETLLLPKKRTQ